MYIQLYTLNTLIDLWLESLYLIVNHLEHMQAVYEYISGPLGEWDCGCWLYFFSNLRTIFSRFRSYSHKIVQHNLSLYFLLLLQVYIMILKTRLHLGHTSEFPQIYRATELAFTI